MTTRQTIEATIREGVGKGAARKTRFKGLVPAVLYGMQQEAMPLAVEPKPILKLLSKGAGSTELLDLKIGENAPIPVLIKDYQASVIRRDLQHIDFLRVDLTKKIQVEVPIKLIGRAAGVQEGGVVEVLTRRLDVRCLPTQIPEAFELDVSALNIGQSLHVSDLKIPPEVEVLTRLETTVVSVVAPAPEEVVAAAPVEGAPAEPEVLTEKAGKEEAAVEGEKKGDKKAEKKSEEKK
ncbi:MAG: 50S ribosomal protein L25/general stress protein Ctc [Deltaproteobacteria bacterium]|nr:50S ribosomal protein L25/general stress protein Ctc [Deltaproteobacteria bacterium]